mmetsp:Transcript_48320/g.113081  ORF Transcript_48320/g.113081 Transcript_48320/m.113081 type:complete len:202 (+) Transcript_48320:696-1301(+)
MKQTHGVFPLRRSANNVSNFVQEFHLTSSNRANDLPYGATLANDSAFEGTIIEKGNLGPTKAIRSNLFIFRCESWVLSLMTRHSLLNGIQNLEFHHQSRPDLANNQDFGRPRWFIVLFGPSIRLCFLFPDLVLGHCCLTVIILPLYLHAVTCDLLNDSRFPLLTILGFHFCANLQLQIFLLLSRCLLLDLLLLDCLFTFVM